MKPFETLAAMPQFVPTETPRTLLNVQSGCIVSERIESPGLVIKSAGGISILDGDCLSKYLRAADLQATLFAEGNKRFG